MPRMIERRRRLREKVEALAEPEFQKFSASLIPGVTRLLGVRLPVCVIWRGKRRGGIGGNCWSTRRRNLMRKR